MTGRLKVLIVEDTLADSELAAAVLGRTWPALEWERVETETAFRQALLKRPDIVIADFEVPGFGAIPALGILRELKSGIPLIVFTGAVTEYIAEQCTRLGAAECLLKDRWSQLAATVRDVLGRNSGAAAASPDQTAES
jgi:DNA-binding NarL/FixJ family response regulator